MTAVDVSATVLDRAAADAATTGVADRIDFRQNDLVLTYPSGASDLVPAQYLHSPIGFFRVHILLKPENGVPRCCRLLFVDYASGSVPA